MTSQTVCLNCESVLQSKLGHYPQFERTALGIIRNPYTQAIEFGDVRS